MFRRYSMIIMIFMISIWLIAACGHNNDNPSDQAGEPPVQEQDGSKDGQHDDSAGNNLPPATEPTQDGQDSNPGPSNQDGGSSDHKTGTDEPVVEVVGDPDAIAVLVNKKFSLPRDYEPGDLVEVDIGFTFKEKNNPRRLMREEAAAALVTLFAGAKEDGIGLLGVSGYRPYSLQKALYEAYVKRDGVEAANRYSARPGHSEHSTGLAMDVTGSDGKCAASDCFGKTPAAKWLDKHAHEYGFIIRYPNGKEDITGYKYEPWHLRYVGIEIATEIYEKGITLEEYYDNAVPVTGDSEKFD